MKLKAKYIKKLTAHPQLLKGTDKFWYTAQTKSK